MNNGGCDPNQECTPTADGGSECGACNRGYVKTPEGCREYLGCAEGRKLPGSTTPCYPGVVCTNLKPWEDPQGRNFSCGSCPGALLSLTHHSREVQGLRCAPD